MQAVADSFPFALLWKTSVVCTSEPKPIPRASTRAASLDKPGGKSPTHTEQTSMLLSSDILGQNGCGNASDVKNAIQQ